MNLSTNMIRPDRVAIYVRWSTDEQSDGTTRQVQLENCEQYVLSQGWTVNPDLVFIDDGYSGGSLDRPELSRLRQLVRDGQVDCIVVFKIDRLSRSVIDTVNLVLREWDGMCYLKSAREPIDTTTAMGKQFFYMLVSYAEWERSVIHERTFSGKVKRAQEGKPQSRPPYGYRISPGGSGWAVVEEQAGVIRQIFRNYLAGGGLGNIAHQLTAQGVPASRGTWSKSAVRQILKNETYTGLYRWGETVRAKGRAGRTQRETGPLAEIPMADPAMAIIDPQTFQAAQALMQDKTPGTAAPGRTWSSPYLLTGLAVCGKCGHAIYSRKRNRATFRDYYGCNGWLQKGLSFCDCGFIPQAGADAEVTARLKQRFADPGARASHLAGKIAELEEQLQAATRNLAEASRGLTQLESQEKLIRREWRLEKITTEEYRVNLAELAEEGEGLRRRQAGLEAEITAIRQQQARQESLAGDAATVEIFDTLPIETRKLLLRQYIEQVRMFKGRNSTAVELEIVWRGE